MTPMMAQKAQFPNAPLPVPRTANSTPPVTQATSSAVPTQTYHDQAQKFIKSAKSMGMGVSAEGGEIIATPKNVMKKTVMVKRKAK